MKKVLLFSILVIIILAVCVLGFNYKKTVEPNQYYQVYYQEKLLGVVSSKSELENYIDKNGNYYKNKYKVDKVYIPNGIVINKITTFSGKTNSVKEVYNKIKKQAPFTIEGYKMTIKRKLSSDNKEKLKNIDIYVLDKKIFKEAVKTLIITYIGEQAYQNYLNGTQEKIETIGTTIENIYVEEDITVKEVNISTEEKIYTDSAELSKFLLYGDNYKQSNYSVKAGDTIDTVAFNNKVNPEELLLANDSLTSTTNLLYPGQQLEIVETNPQLNIVEETYIVKDVESNYKTEEQYDNSIIMGDEVIITEGEKGMDRITQKVKEINGEIVYVDPLGKQVLKSPTNKVVLKGNKYVSGVGSLTNWGWPTDSGWTLSSGYAYRSNPVSGSRELHSGLDISGTGYGSNIYATNNGKVIIAESHWSYGNYVVIDHNNGYMTVYAHMSKILTKVGRVVDRGTIIGKVGSTGVSTGPHVHYEIWKGAKWNHINPAILYPGGFR